MKYRKLGRTNLQVSELGFGAWAIGGALKLGEQSLSYGQTSNKESLRALRVAMDNGINFFDTADIYGDGLSEQLIGQAIKGRRGEVVVATKVGNVVKRDELRFDLSYSHIVEACEKSLKRLGTDYIDLYQLHFPPESDEYLEALGELKKEGKIRFAGVSIAHQFDKAKQFMESEVIDTLLLYYNLLLRTAEDVVLNHARRHNIGIIVASPLSRGLLTGKFGKNINFSAEDVRSRWNDGEKDRDWFLEQLEAVAKIKSKLTVNNERLTNFSLNFPLWHPAVSTVIAGMKNEEQLLQNLKSF
ncbi:aldo/keto reductase [Patescibacteria group bacterium]